MVFPGSMIFSWPVYKFHMTADSVNGIVISLFHYVIWLNSVTHLTYIPIYKRLPWRTKYLLGWKFVPNILRPCPTNDTFVCHRSRVKRTLRGKQRTFPPYLSFPSKEFPATTYRTLKTYALPNMKFDSIRSIMKGTLLEKQSTFSTVSRLLFKGFHSKALFWTLCACPTTMFCSN